MAKQLISILLDKLNGKVKHSDLRQVIVPAEIILRGSIKHTALQS
ncbi:hypothetical protein ACFQ3S_08935 [Mucilaginibacter terrae]